MAGFTEGQLAELKLTWAMFDADESGLIDIKEVGTMVRSLGQNPTKAKLDVIVQALDPEGRGTVSFDEFVDVVSNHMTADPKADLRDSFKLFDEDGSGFVKRDKLKCLLTTLGEVLSEEEINDFFKRIDMGKDGKINIEDITKILMSST